VQLTPAALYGKYPRQIACSAGPRPKEQLPWPVTPPTRSVSSCSGWIGVTPVLQLCSKKSHLPEKFNNELDATSLFPVLSNNDKRPVFSNRTIRRHVLGDGHRSAPPHHAAPNDSGTARTSGRRHSVRTGYPGFHAFAPPRQAEKRGTRECAPRGNLPLVSREHGRA
jgi:hypothetical protein